MIFKAFLKSKLYFHSKTICRKQEFCFVLFHAEGFGATSRSVNKMTGQTNKKHLREQTVPSLRTKLKNMNKLQK